MGRDAQSAEVLRVLPRALHHASHGPTLRCGNRKVIPANDANDEQVEELSESCMRAGFRVGNNLGIHHLAERLTLGFDLGEFLEVEPLHLQITI